MDVPLIEYFKVGPWDYIGAIKEVRGRSIHKPKGDGAFQNYLVLSLSKKNRDSNLVSHFTGVADDPRDGELK